MNRRYDVLTLHPEIVTGPLGGSIVGRAVAASTIAIGVHDMRAHAINAYGTVDDNPYGGGAGMVLRVDVVAAAIAAVRTPESRVLLMSATGRPFVQADAVRLSACPHLVLVCGHYEGIDARIETVVDEELSLGDFVLTGGEIAACAIVDAVARLVPGVVGNADSVHDESFAAGLLEHPHYTRPREWNGLEVPAVLMSGHHERIAAWRRAQSEERTRLRRPDLWERHVAAVDAKRREE
jgi:tRNA (guanine37-N1)-methyltransferase